MKTYASALIRAPIVRIVLLKLVSLVAALMQPVAVFMEINVMLWVGLLSRAEKRDGINCHSTRTEATPSWFAKFTGDSFADYHGSFAIRSSVSPWHSAGLQEQTKFLPFSSRLILATKWGLFSRYDSKSLHTCSLSPCIFMT